MEELKVKLTLLPDKPGVYIMRDICDTVIYVGKAKSLKKRVRSYFTGSHDTKTAVLVSNIHNFEYIVTDSAVEALILECNLIKQYTPKYNIMLKDDKSYPYIKLTKEEHPRLLVVRKVEKDLASYYGPYHNAVSAQQTTRLLNRIFPLRKCTKLKTKPCLYHHIGQCMAPCVNEVPIEDYTSITRQIVSLLKGGEEAIIKALTVKMLTEAADLNFERAKELRDQINDLQLVQQKQKMTNSDNVDRDVFGYDAQNGIMAVQVFNIRSGKLLARDAAIFPYHTSEAEALQSYVQQYYFTNPVRPKEILLSEGPDNKILSDWLNLPVKSPKRSQKKELVDLASANAAEDLREHLHLMNRDEERTTKALESLGIILGIPTPWRIEAFDNSNLQGRDAVAAMVVFKNSKPLREDYRKYKIKFVNGSDDCASMAEVVKRRYSRLLSEGSELPDLILVDGGKGQVNSAYQVLSELGLDLPIAGIAKDEFHRTSNLVLPNNLNFVQVVKGSQEFFLLQRIQDEVHRFAVTFHRQKRSKNMLVSALDNIPGVGEKRRLALLRHFGTLQQIKNAAPEDFRAAGIGLALADIIIKHLNANDTEDN